MIFLEFEQGADSVMVWIGLARASVVFDSHFIQGNLNARVSTNYTLPCYTERLSQE